MNKEEEKVIGALNDSHYEWRTIKGLSTATGLDASKVLSIIEKNASEIVQSSSFSPAGEALYSTREKRRKNSSTLSRLGSALRNRAD